MPLPISLAHRLAKQLTKVRKDGTLSYLRPDGKTQVTVEYVNDRPARVDTVVVSTQHGEEVSLETIREDLIREVIRPIVPKELLDDDTRIYVNPTGRFVIGGPQGDSGLTGRKIIVDTYGGYARHGGGAFSGKDPTKVDRLPPMPPAMWPKILVAAGSGQTLRNSAGICHWRGSSRVSDGGYLRHRQGFRGYALSGDQQSV